MRSYPWVANYSKNKFLENFGCYEKRFERAVVYVRYILFMNRENAIHIEFRNFPDASMPKFM